MCARPESGAAARFDGADERRPVPRVACVDCFGEVDWFEAKGTGKIHSFTLVRVPRNPAFKEEAPIYYINVILDEGVIIESRLLGDNKQKVRWATESRCARADAQSGD